MCAICTLAQPILKIAGMMMYQTFLPESDHVVVGSVKMHKNVMFTNEKPK